MFEHSPPSCGIVDAAYYLPGDPIDLCDWAPREGVDAGRVTRLIENGCRYFHACGDESDEELITQAVERLVARSGVDPAGIDFVLHAHTQPFSVPPAPESLLARLFLRFNIRPRLAFSVGQLACAGVVNAIDVARRLLAAMPGSHYALVVTSDRVFGGARYRLRQDAGIQSDGASALLLGRTTLRARIDAVHVKSHGGLAEGPSTPELAKRVGMLAWSHTRRMVEEDIARIGVPAAAIAAVMPTNADAPYWRKLGPLLGLTPSQLFLDNIGRRGHSCCSDLAINLVDEGFTRLAQGPVVLFSQSNVGAYGSVTLGAPQ